MKLVRKELTPDKNLLKVTYRDEEPDPFGEEYFSYFYPVIKILPASGKVLYRENGKLKYFIP